MTISNYNKHLSCSICGRIPTITLLKVSGPELVLKQKCPEHGERLFKIPLIEKPHLMPHFRMGIFRCYKCGQDATVDHVKFDGPWALIKCRCERHGRSLPYQKIWSTIYTESSFQGLNSSPTANEIENYSTTLNCVSCGKLGTILVLKVIGPEIFIKQKCPNHRVVTYTIDLFQRDLFLPTIRRAIYRCYKCGEDATINLIKTSGHFTVVKAKCPKGHFGLPYQKIWSTIFAELSDEVHTTPFSSQPAFIEKTPAKSSGNINFCPNCGSRISSTEEKFCGNCGVGIQ